MNIIDEIRNAWGWIGLDPLEVVGENDFGNLIIKDVRGRYWRMTPEECTCEVIAVDRQALDALTTDQEFLHDWYMTSLVEIANQSCGPLVDDRKYCLKIPGLLGGEYVAKNLGTVPVIELLRISGDIARQVRDLPDGAQVSLQIVD
jgi:hypothetical protein